MNVSVQAEIEQTREDTTDVALIWSSSENAEDVSDEEVQSMIREAAELVGAWMRSFRMEIL